MTAYKMQWVTNSVRFRPMQSAMVPKTSAPIMTPVMNALIVKGESHALSHTRFHSEFYKIKEVMANLYHDFGIIFSKFDHLNCHSTGSEMAFVLTIELVEDVSKVIDSHLDESPEGQALAKLLWFLARALSFSSR